MRETAPDFVGDCVYLRQEAGAVWLPRDVVHVSGPEAGEFLQGQLSQDVLKLGIGEGRFSLLLQPQGKVDAFLRVTRAAGDLYVLDTDAGWGERVAARLNRFKLRTKADIEQVPWRCLALRGDRVQELLLEATDPGSLRTAPWPDGPRGVDVLGSRQMIPHGFRECGLDAWEALRIESGMPKMGAELDESTIPAEAGQPVIDRTVSFTKGCYTGQELVARIDSRGGNVPRHLWGVVVGTDVLPPVGARVVADGRDIGRLTSVAESLERRAPVALALVGRAAQPPAEVTIAWDGGEAPAQLQTLPLVRR